MILRSNSNHFWFHFWIPKKKLCISLLYNAVCCDIWVIWKLAWFHLFPKVLNTQGQVDRENPLQWYRSSQWQLRRMIVAFSTLWRVQHQEFGPRRAWKAFSLVARNVPFIMHLLRVYSLHCMIHWWTWFETHAKSLHVDRLAWAKLSASIPGFNDTRSRYGYEWLKPKQCLMCSSFD